jgi:hypothetical protein
VIEHLELFKAFCGRNQYDCRQNCQTSTKHDVGFQIQGEFQATSFMIGSPDDLIDGGRQITTPSTASTTAYYYDIFAEMRLIPRKKAKNFVVRTSRLQATGSIKDN